MNNYSYITLLSDDSYIYGIILLHETLKSTNAKYPLTVLVTSNVSKPILCLLDQLNLKYKIISPIYNVKILEFNQKINPALAKTWSYCLSKFEIFNMTEYDKVLFLDADIMILKNLDHIFQYPHMTSALDGEYFNIWPDNPHFNSGILLIEPNKDEYQKLLTFATSEAIDNWHRDECFADQEILNMYYSDWINKPELHLNKYYDIFAPYIQEEQISDIDENCYFIHYVGRKPWRAFMKLSSETYTEKYYTQAHTIIQECVNQLDWNIVKQNIKLAIYSICKNEIESVEKFLKCFTKADYVCILDTGSTDGTWEYLQSVQYEYPNLIIDQKIINPWRFDTARNISLTLVPKDTTMYFMMDLDEIIKEDDWVEKVKNSWDPLFSRGQYLYNRFVDPTTDTPTHYFTEGRIHNNTWHYHGIVHEQLCNICGERLFFQDECIQVPITVWHYPTKNNKSFYIKLCQDALKEEPDNELMRLQLAIEYEVNQYFDEAIKEYTHLINLPESNLNLIELGRCYASLGRILKIQGKVDDSLTILQKGYNQIPNCSDNYFIAAEILYEQGKFQESYELCQSGLDNGVDNQWCSIIDKNGYYPYLLMGLCQINLNNEILGLGYITIAKEKNNSKENKELFHTILNKIMKRR